MKEQSIIKEALIDYNEIVEAASNNAKSKLADEFPDKFKNLLKEELKDKKTDKKSKIILDDNKESELSDESEKTKESDMKNQKKETKNKVNEDFEDHGLQGVESEDSGMSDNTNSDANNTEANEMDERITMEEIERELSEMEEFQNKPNDSILNNEPEMKEENNDSNLLKEIKDMLEKYIGSEDNKESDNVNDQEPPKDNFENGNPYNGNESVNEVEEEISDADIQAALAESEEEIEEAHGVTYSARRNNVGRHLPDADHLSKGELDQSPQYVQESNKKIAGFVNEVKTLTKKLNESRKNKEEVTKLLESYKTALGRYRTQLSEMAIFNTNLSHVNNLLVNEELALTHDDKVRIICEIKKATSITESENIYKSFLTEMKSSKKNIIESIEDKLDVVVSPSSNSKLNEVVEKTAYNDPHINRIKEIMADMDKRKTKKIR